MRPIVKRGIFLLFVGCTLLVLSARTDHDVGPDGLTHAEEIAPKLRSSGGSGELSEMVKVTGLQFRRQAPKYFQDWHTAPRRQYVITLSGRGEVELTGGKKIPLEPGHILLAEDVTGKGHISRGVGTEDRISLFIPLADQ